MLPLSQKDIVLRNSDYRKFADLIYRTSGIHLGHNKQELMKTRFLKIMRRLSLTSFREYYDYVTDRVDKTAFSEMIDAISTNHTFFFREKTHFDFLRGQILPELMRKKKNDRKLRIWCAASSSGEEPYSIAISVLGTLPPEWDIRVLATDISTRVLKKAMEGRYRQNKLKEMSPATIARCFDREDGGEGHYLVKPEIKRIVTFRQFNLMSERFPFKNSFDVIFCRNVMIYFDAQTQETLTEKMLAHLAPGGFFFIGHSETVPAALRTQLTALGPAAFRKT